MNALELFAGIGGLSLGLERAGITVVGQVEIDPYCRRVLAKHWPEVPRHDDVRTALEWWLDEPRPRVDLVVGGYPCQPESTAGKRRGADDERWLWPAMAAIVEALRPSYVLGENVMGHRTLGLDTVLVDLDHLGYDTLACSLSAYDVGAPHVRQRLFTLARRAVSDPHGEGCLGRSAAVEPGPGRGRHPARDRGWSPFTGPRRMVDGVSPGLDRLAPARLKALGNAVVPRMAEVIGRLIIQDHEGRPPASVQDHEWPSPAKTDRDRCASSTGIEVAS